MSRVLVIVPAYNESETIPSVIDALHEHAPSYDILVIDDGSTDGTSDAVRATGGATLVRLPYNLGIGAAMQTGYKYAHRNDYDVAVQCDADGQHPVHQITRLVECLHEGDADLVIGSRYVTDTDYRPSFGRRVGKSLLSRMVDRVVGGGITDTTSGFRALNRAAIELFVRYYPDDYPEAEAIVIIHGQGLKAREIPVDMQARQGGRSSIGMGKSIYYIVKVSLAIFIGAFKRITGAPEPSSATDQGTAGPVVKE